MRRREGPSGYEWKPVRAFFRRAAPLVAAVSISCAPVQKAARPEPPRRAASMKVKKDTIEELLKAWKNHDPKAQEKALDSILMALEDPNATEVMRELALASLLARKSEVLPVLVGMMEFGDMEGGNPAFDLSDKRLFKIANKAWAMIDSMGAPVLPDVIRLLGKSRSPTLRSISIGLMVYLNCPALGTCRNPKDMIRQLLKRLDDDSEVVREDAIKALARIGDRSVLPELGRVARKDKAIFIRWLATRAMDAIRMNVIPAKSPKK